MDERPNILWYCTDQQRFDTIRSLGNAHIRTPNIDRLLTEGVGFTRAYCQSPICTPSRASFLTGMYPSAVAVNGNGVPRFPACHAEHLIPRRLSDAGYDCGLIGKLHISSAYGGREERVQDGYRYFQYSHAPKGPLLPGHDYARWIADQGYDPSDLIEPTVRKEEYRDGERLRNFGGLVIPTRENDNIPPHLHQSHWCTEKAIEFISQNRTGPWMLSVNPFDPHPPFDAPWEYYHRYDAKNLPGAHFREEDLAHQDRVAGQGVDFQTRPRDPEAFDHKEVQASYYAMIELIDNEFGRILQYLEEEGLRHNTLVIFMSDHGESLGDHGLLLKGCRFIEGLVRVPLVISWPRRYRSGLISDALVELIDLAPTIYEAAGVSTPFFLQGGSLSGLLTGEQVQHRQFVRCESFGSIDYPDQTEATMYRDERWKLVAYHGKALFELYDLQSDPWEHKDLSEDPAYRDVRNRLLQASFDAAIRARTPQEPRVAPY